MDNIIVPAIVSVSREPTADRHGVPIVTVEIVEILLQALTLKRP